MNGLEVTADGTGVVSHAGVALVRALADNTGLTRGLSAALASARLLIHDRGRVFADLACAIADGGEAISDFRVIGDQGELFGAVASVPTAWRALAEIAAGGEAALERIRAAVNSARRTAWANVTARHGGLPGVRVADKVLAGVGWPALDAAGGSCPSGKGGAEANFQGFRCRPRPGFSANNAHAVGPELGRGASAWRESPHGAGGRKKAQAAARPPPGRGGGGGDGWSAWRESRRSFPRRERPRPGAQLTLFEIEDGYRYSLWVTNLPKATRNWRGNQAYIDAAHRVHARVEDGIRTGKDCGIGRFPSEAMAMNKAWFSAALIAATLLAWLRLLALDGKLAKAEPKTLRYKILHAAGRLVRGSRRRQLKIQASWPWAADIARAWQRISALANAP